MKIVSIYGSYLPSRFKFPKFHMVDHATQDKGRLGSRKVFSADRRESSHNFAKRASHRMSRRWTSAQSEAALALGQHIHTQGVVKLPSAVGRLLRGEPAVTNIRFCDRQHKESVSSRRLSDSLQDTLDGDSPVLVKGGTRPDPFNLQYYRRAQTPTI